MSKSDPAERAVRDIRRKTRKQYSAEEKIRIVVSGLRGEESIAALCRHEGIAEGLYYSWSKEFLEAGKKRLAGDTARQATSTEVKTLRAEARNLKEALLIKAGTPRRMNRSISTSMTSVELSLRCTRIARHSRLSSSRMFSVRNTFPSSVL